jgi:TolA-binding protein
VQSEAAARQDRIEELEFLIRQTTAENEQLQLELHSAQQEVARLQRIVSDMAAAQQALSETHAANPDPAADTEEERIAAARQAATGTLGTLPVDAPLPQPAAIDPQEAATAFRQARELLLSAPLPEAQAAFAAYLQAYPTGEDAPDARYWYAFTLLGQGDYRNAAAAFAEYIELHGNDPGPRNQAPAALLRLGISLAGLGMRNDACAAFRDAAAHPRASQTTRAQAAQEGRRNGCPAG